MKTDSELMLDFRHGDREAFDVLVRRHQVSLYNYFLRISWDFPLAEDLTQEVFLRLYKHADEYVPRDKAAGGTKFRAYLYRIARNSWIDHLRRTKRERETVSIEAHEHSSTLLEKALSATGEAPEDSARRKERMEVLARAIETLPDEHKQVIVLSTSQQMKYSEIAQVLEIPIGTVKSRMHNAVRMLRDELEKTSKSPFQ